MATSVTIGYPPANSLQSSNLNAGGDFSEIPDEKKRAGPYTIVCTIAKGANSYTSSTFTIPAQENEGYWEVQFSGVPAGSWYKVTATLYANGNPVALNPVPEVNNIKIATLDDGMVGGE